MRRALWFWLAVVAATALACGGSNGNASTTPRVTSGALGPLAEGLLTQTQLRQVPGLSTALVMPLQSLTVFDEPDPRGPCGGKVPQLSLRNAAGVAITGETLRGGAQMIARPPAGAAKRYLDARMADTTAGCAAFQTTTQQAARQVVQLVRIVRLHREFQQALAVVTALTSGDAVRASTQIDVRRGDVLARAVIFSDVPMPNVAVRGIASLMGQNLLMFEGE